MVYIKYREATQMGWVKTKSSQAGLQAQAERTKKTEERRGGYMATSHVGSDKSPEPGDVAQSRGRETMVCIKKTAMRHKRLE